MNVESRSLNYPMDFGTFDYDYRSRWIIVGDRAAPSMPTPDSSNPQPTPRAAGVAAFYALAALAGIAIGWADVTVNDLLFTALLVLAACMLLGLMRPLRPWRWVVTVGVFVPLTEFAAYMLRACLLYTSPSPRDLSTSRMPSSA